MPKGKKKTEKLKNYRKKKGCLLIYFSKFSYV